VIQGEEKKKDSKNNIHIASYSEYFIARSTMSEISWDDVTAPPSNFRVILL